MPALYLCDYCGGKVDAGSTCTVQIGNQKGPASFQDLYALMVRQAGLFGVGPQPPERPQPQALRLEFCLECALRLALALKKAQLAVTAPASV